MTSRSASHGPCHQARPNRTAPRKSKLAANPLSSALPHTTTTTAVLLELRTLRSPPCSRSAGQRASGSFSFSTSSSFSWSSSSVRLISHHASPPTALSDPVRALRTCRLCGWLPRPRCGQFSYAEVSLYCRTIGDLRFSTCVCTVMS